MNKNELVAKVVDAGASNYEKDQFHVIRSNNNVNHKILAF
mgnify:CR=1 FL=1